MQTKCFWSSSSRSAVLSGVLIRTSQPTTILHVAIAPRVRATCDKNFPGASGVATDEEGRHPGGRAPNTTTPREHLCIAHGALLMICGSALGPGYGMSLRRRGRRETPRGQIIARDHLTSVIRRREGARAVVSA
ncbi:hypothetical protein MRX96_058313 [Rhipicephalus microplus]